MIQLSDYDYPILVNPYHFSHYFRNLDDKLYTEEFRLKNFFQEIIKNGVLFEKSENTASLMKSMSFVIKGESVYLKNFNFITGNWITRMQFINGMKKVFKEKILKEFTGLDFVQFCCLLCNDFDRNAILDIFTIYNSKLNTVCEKTEEELLKQVYSHERLIDIFSLYFFYFDFLQEAKNAYNEVAPVTLTIEFSKLRDKLNTTNKIKSYEKHIFYKILLILNPKVKDPSEKYHLFKFEDLKTFTPEGSKKIYLYSFMTVLCKYCIEARILMNSMQRYYKFHHDIFIQNSDSLLEMDEDEDFDV